MKIHNTEQVAIIIEVPNGFPEISVSGFQAFRQLTDKVDPTLIEDCLVLAVAKALQHFPEDFVFPAGKANEIYFTRGVYAYGFAQLLDDLPVNQQLKSDPVAGTKRKSQNNYWGVIGVNFLKDIPGFLVVTQQHEFTSTLL